VLSARVVTRREQRTASRVSEFPFERALQQAAQTNRSILQQQQLLPGRPPQQTALKERGQNRELVSTRLCKALSVVQHNQVRVLAELENVLEVVSVHVRNEEVEDGNIN